MGGAELSPQPGLVPARAPGRSFARDGAGRTWLVGALLILFWGLAFLWALRLGPTGSYAWSELWPALVGSGADASAGHIVRWRALRALTALAVGGSLALSGAYLQGLFRNALASPGVLGVTAGSSLGAALAIAVLGGFGPGLVLEAASGLGTLAVTLAALIGALAVLVPLVLVAGRGGQFSVPSLLLAGMAMNALCSGFLAAVQSLTLGDFEVARALFAWAFGTLDDRAGWQVGLALGGLLLGLAAIPFLAEELDLLAGGDEDAAALGVAVGRVRGRVLFLAALLAATAVSVAGQILFVGLIAPHLVRLTTGARHRSLLPLSVLSGGALLLGADCLQRTLFAEVDLRPGVLMSLIGAPFFLVLLARQREALRAW